MIAVEYESNVFIKWTAITTLQPNRKGSAKALRERGFFQINNRYTHFFYRLSLNQRWALFNLPSAWCLRRFRRPAGWDAFLDAVQTRVLFRYIFHKIAFLVSANLRAPKMLKRYWDHHPIFFPYTSPLNPMRTTLAAY